MLVPILSEGNHLIVSIQASLSDREILELERRILEKVRKHAPRGVVVDVSALDVIDSFSTRTLADIAAAVRLLGSNMVVVGVQLEVAMSMVLLGLTMAQVPTALDLDMGLNYLARQSA